jgi:hypothetical protein
MESHLLAIGRGFHCLSPGTTVEIKSFDQWLRRTKC